MNEHNKQIWVNDITHKLVKMIATYEELEMKEVVKKLCDMYLKQMGPKALLIKQLLEDDTE